jgi:hypothetical protein
MSVTSKIFECSLHSNKETVAAQINRQELPNRSYPDVSASASSARGSTNRFRYIPSMGNAFLFLVIKQPNFRSDIYTPHRFELQMR